MSFPLVDHTALGHHSLPFKTVSSLFTVFLEGNEIFDTLKADDLEKLLKAGADINEKEEKSKMNFLQRCIVEKFSWDDLEGIEFAKIVKLLFSHGIDVNNQDTDGRTALHLAVSEGEFNLAKFLLKKGANRSIVDASGKTPYDYVNDFKPNMMSSTYIAARYDILELLKL